MKSETLGTNISQVEVTNISRHGFWVLVGEEELFLPFNEFPWFKDASLPAVLTVEIHHAGHLYWPDLDVDLTLESIRHPEKYPLKFKSNTQQTTATNRSKSRGR
jgi:hypothetical protein